MEEGSRAGAWSWIPGGEKAFCRRWGCRNAGWCESRCADEVLMPRTRELGPGEALASSRVGVGGDGPCLSINHHYHHHTTRTRSIIGSRRLSVRSNMSPGLSTPAVGGAPPGHHHPYPAMLQLLQRLTSPPEHTLTELRPTSSTVQYTVSTRTAPTTLPQWMKYYVFILLRIVVGISALLALALKWVDDSGYPPHAGPWKWICDTIFGAHQAWAMQIIKAMQWGYLIPCVLFVIYLVLRRGYTGTFLQPTRTPTYRIHS